MAKDTDRFIIEIPGMTIKRIRDGRLEYFANLQGAVYDNAKLEAVQAMEDIYVETARQINEIGKAASKK